MVVGSRVLATRAMSMRRMSVMVCRQSQSERVFLASAFLCEDYLIELDGLLRTAEQPGLEKSASISVLSLLGTASQGL
jgi:hypothetical protein